MKKFIPGYFTHTEYNGTLLRYGLLKFMELRFGAGFAGNTTEILNSDDNPAKAFINSTFRSFGFALSDLLFQICSFGFINPKVNNFWI